MHHFDDNHQTDVLKQLDNLSYRTQSIQGACLCA